MLATISRPNTRLRSLLLVAPLILLVALLPLSLVTMQPQAAPPLPQLAKLPLSFEPNKGQTDPSVKYMTHASGGTMYFTPDEVVLSLQSASEGQPSAAKGSVGLSSLSNSDKAADAQQTTRVVHLQFISASPDAVMSSGEALPGKVNYFIGNDPSNWHSDLPTYGNITYSGLYSGIDLTYSGTGGQLKGTYTVAAGSDPSQIRWRYIGAENVTVDGTGNLQITVANTNKDAHAVTVTEQVPVAWQEIAGTRTPVSARYLVAADQSIAFGLGSYDRNHPLIIDPTLTYSTYLGGNGYDEGSGVAVDTSGNAYVTGSTSSTNFPLQNPFQPAHGGTYDVFVTKFNASGSTLLYSTYLGGSGSDYGRRIAVDGAGNAYVTGGTQSTNFPLQNPFQPTYAGGISDAFVTKFSPSGTTLIYSTYLGGIGYEGGEGIAVDATGHAYVTGYTDSANFPLQNPFQPTNAGYNEAFVTKFSPTGSTLLYSTYLGGSGGDFGHGIAVDATGNAYVMGITSSTNFPLQNPFQPTLNGINDLFVTKLSTTGSALINSTYLGGSQPEWGYSIAVDTSGNAHVTGYTQSTNFPLQNPFQPTFGGIVDAFVTKFSPTGSTLLYSTYLGGSGDDYGHGIAVDGAGNAYVTGHTASTNFPLQNPFQPTYAGGFYDAFVTKFSPSGTTLIYSTYLGGSGREAGYGIAVDGAGNAYVTGSTDSTNFPLQDPFQPTYGGGSTDAFVAKIYDQQGTPQPTNTPASPTNTRTSTLTNTPVPPTGTSIPTSTPIPPTSTSIPPTITPVPPTSTVIPPTSTIAPPTGTTTVVGPTNTPVPSVTNTIVPTSTTVPPTSTSVPPTATREPCTLTFTDVPDTNTFYTFIRCLACRGIISGYADGTFKPNNLVTRGQLAKIVSNAAGFTEDPEPQIFQDVSSSNTFYQWINRLARRGHMSGYACGGAGEPCTTGMPYFRPFANATRGQTSKIVSNAAGYSEIPTEQTFEDVPLTHTFYTEIQRLASRNIMGGYACGGPGEPCLSGKPYFRPGNDVTRGQSSKIVANTFFPACNP